jgi:aminoglycoside/choline kinase family phosphotransferase
MHERENALKEWLIKSINRHDFILTPLAGDASFRRYFRLQYNGLSQIVMDAPPDKENSEPFVHIAQVLSKENVPTPEIVAMDLQQGFLLLGDFGDQLLLGKLKPETANHYYHKAISTLFRIQKCPITDPKLPAFDAIFMQKEMNLCPEWFFKAYLSLELLEEEHRLVNETISWLSSEVAKQPIVFIHRDYHSRNLMLVEGQNSLFLGVIDFQDAMRGPLTYDLVSLLKDCYIAWPREEVITWVTFFYNQSPHTSNYYSLTGFIRAFDLCGLQRHLKVLGVFSRLYLRDGKAGYLANLPLTLHYVLECCELYEELHPLLHLLQKRVYLP